MQFSPKEPPRVFPVGLTGEIKISDCGKMRLEADELITFDTESGAEYDVVRKDWGFYATPSMNGRLKNYGFKSALVKNKFGFIYVMLVEEGKTDEFQAYLEVEEQKVVQWLDELEPKAKSK